jgi:RHS repeat-associated protein
LQAGAGRDLLDVAQLLESFAEENPSSPWTPSLRANLGWYYFEEGSYTKALDQMERAWMATKDHKIGPGKRIADYALAHWTRFLLALGRLEQLEVILAETQGTALDGGPLQQRFLRTREKYGIMRSHPAAAYRCGWMVMDHLVQQARGRGLSASSDWALYQEDNLLHACSMNALVQMGQIEQWSVVGVERPEGSRELPFPCVMHLKQGHFIALLGMEGPMVMAYDPVYGPRPFRPEVLNFEGSGRFVVPAGRTPSGWRSLTKEEMADTLGRCGGDMGSFGYFDCEETDCPTDDGASGSPNSSPRTGEDTSEPQSNCGGGTCADGMPRWRVTEPNINLWLRDTPLRCQPAYGPSVGFDLCFKQRDEYTYRHENVFSFGPGWNCRWLSWVDNLYFNYPRPTSVELHMPGGGKLPFRFTAESNTASDYFYNSRLSLRLNGSTLLGFTWELPDGSKYIYEQSWESRNYYLSSYTDRNGFVTRFSYTGMEEETPMLRLDTVADTAGDTLFSLQYTNTTYPNLVSSVTDRFGRSAHLSYTDVFYSPHISQIQDAAGLISTIDYDENGWPDTMATPYGTTSFSYQWSDTESAYYRWIRIAEPNGGNQHYAFRYNTAQLWSGLPWMPNQFPASLVPSGLPSGTLLDNDASLVGGPSMYCSFYWDQRQSVGLSSTLTQITTNQMNKARLRHWLVNSTALLAGVDLALSFEVAPSQSTDGTTWGQITWYDYADKISGWSGVRGTNIQPSLITRKLPDGSTWYETYSRNSWGLPTTVTSTYGGYYPSTRSYTYTYAANGQDLTETRYPGNTLVTSYAYDSYHRRTNEIVRPDANSSYTNTWIYDDYGRLATNITMAGQTYTYAYNASSDGFSGYLSGASGQPIAANRSYTWKNGSVYSFTNERGLCVTNFWDGLNRLTGRLYPDGTTTTNLYSRGAPYANGTGAGAILDVTAAKDRMNHWTYYDYDPIRRKVTETNANNVVTRYGYCDCGSFSSVTNAWGTPVQQITTYTYDNQGNRLLTAHADGYSVTNWFNALGQVVATGDGTANRWLYYNNQGLLTNVSTAYGAEKLIFHDTWDRPQYVTDVNGVTTTNTYDNLARLLSRKYPDGGTECFGYSARGLIAYTNQISQKTYYSYDALARRAFETNANNEIIRYTNNVAGDLLSLTDGKNQTTRWNYDGYGRVTNKLDQAGTVVLRYKYDPNGRLTNRWSVAKGDTVYSYDALDNLTSINYPSSTDVTFQYDWLNRLTNMVDAAGTTKYAWTSGNQLLIEDGPFANDNLTNVYSNRLRTNLSLQQPAGVWTNRFIYDLAGRLTNVTSPAGAFGYLYKSVSGSSPSLVARILLPNASYITNEFDPVARMLATSLKNSSHTPLDVARYGFNTAHQLTAYTNAANVYYQYAYDNIGQLKVADSSVNTEDRGYFYDTAWNLNYRTNNGTLQTVTVDSKNQLLTAFGNNCSYDSNGNLTSGISRTFTYDDENQLATVTWGGGSYRTELVYDGFRRLRKRVEKFLSGGTWTTISETLYCYDGNRVIQERNSANTPSVAYTRGLDLSSALEGAGGIGGLLSRSHGYSSGSWSTHHFYHADGNGNITALVDSAQALSASYRYDPFGRTISSSGSMAGANVYRFSSKELIYDGAGGYYYYLYRFYDPNLQRWLNRDPIGEDGGLNLYAFVCNNPPGWIDDLGEKNLRPGHGRPGGRNPYRLPNGRPLPIILPPRPPKPINHWPGENRPSMVILIPIPGSNRTGMEAIEEAVTQEALQGLLEALRPSIQPPQLRPPAPPPFIPLPPNSLSCANRPPDLGIIGAPPSTPPVRILIPKDSPPSLIAPGIIIIRY